ncbi:replicative DNA helicase [Reichenbachiella carrageenanivorans]|uniref:Replicative DNA helicase n=1 Tax=Reichenbachiella carrageenanivorans TaxID=2979869 RepID=A0ABY6CWC1_9BACT|nr:replicative DNA helicase [Reichenbachiella carrageenanivorans]UXX78009.1 replicative DNA helicase [Reichenbachiella carrageenanivorans]
MTKQNNNTELLGKVPPQNLDMEQVVLGAMMLEKDSINHVVGFLEAEDFYSPAHGLIFKAILTLFGKSEPVDIMTVVAQLREDGNIETVGGAHAVVSLTTRVNSAANIDAHSKIIKEQALKRALIKLGSEIVNLAYNETEDVFDLIERTDQQLYKLSATLSSSSYVDMGSKKVVKSLVDQIEASREAYLNNEVIGVPCGLSELDRITGGFRSSELIIIAARPAMGKSAMVASIMKNCAEFGQAVGMFSLEMSWTEIGIRMIAMHSEVMLESLRNGNIKEYELERILHKSGNMIDKPIYVDDSAALSIFQMRTKARMLKKKHDIKLLIVDYMQLGEGNQGGNREQEIASISRGLKNIAKELDIPVIALSQLSRAVETRGGNKRPQLSDLRESGSIEQDADKVMFLYRPEYYEIMETEEGYPTAGIGEVIIAKNRNGRLGSAWLQFLGQYTKWQDQSGDWHHVQKEPMAVQELPDQPNFPITDTNFGKTKIHQLINDARLDRVKRDRRAYITRESIERFLKTPTNK